MKITIETDGGEHEEAQDKGSQGIGPQDVWHFDGIRKTLWGDGSSVAGPRDVWDFAGIRKTLWGK